MKSVLIAIQPKYCELIANGKKTVEVRKTKPKLDVPFKVYIYCTKTKGNEKPLLCTTNHIDWENIDLNAKVTPPYIANSQVIGEFVCDRIDEYTLKEFEWEKGDITLEYHIPTIEGEKTCLEYDEVREYGNGKPLYFWHISNLVIYDKQKELGEFIVPSKIGCCNEGKCRGCKFLDRGNGFNIEDDCNAKFCTDEYKPLRKAPQSWCYVEELGV